jgi:cell wall-associated NlpC family hydrolase
MMAHRLSLLLGALALASAAPASAQEFAPVKALSERAVNPKGPFAKLNVPQRDSLIEHTRSLLGTRYKWAGITPEKGLDCSGFVKYVFAKLGVELPHHAADLAKLGGSITKDTAEMKPGDLLVFGKGKHISHVGIYVGDGNMIQASSTSRRVIETPVVRYRPPGGLQWKGVRRVIELVSTTTDADPESSRP